MSTRMWLMLGLSLPLWLMCITAVAWCDWLGWNYQTAVLFAWVFGSMGFVLQLAVFLVLDGRELKITERVRHGQQIRRTRRSLSLSQRRYWCVWPITGSRR